MTERLRLGVVGFGWFAELLVHEVLNGLDRLEVTAVCDPDPVRRRRGEELLGASAHEDLGVLLALSDCDAVAIFTPHSSHRALVAQAAAAGRHVFCEKAMAVTSADCVAMIHAADQADVALVVGHMQKLFPSHRRLVELVRSGRYGAPVAANISGFHWCPVHDGWWRRRADCGGLLYWTGVHDLDTLRHVMGAEVEEVHAMAGPDTDGYTDYEDSIIANLRYANGAVASLHVAEHDPLRTFEESFAINVLCESGAVAFDPRNNKISHAHRAGVQRDDPVAESFPAHEESMFVAYRAEFEHFCEVVLDGRPSELPAVDGLRCVETLEAIYASVASGRAVAVRHVDA